MKNKKRKKVGAKEPLTLGNKERLREPQGHWRAAKSLMECEQRPLRQERGGQPPRRLEEPNASLQPERDRLTQFQAPCMRRNCGPSRFISMGLQLRLYQLYRFYFSEAATLIFLMSANKRFHPVPFCYSVTGCRLMETFQLSTTCS